MKLISQAALFCTVLYAFLWLCQKAITNNFIFVALIIAGLAVNYIIRKGE